MTDKDVPTYQVNYPDGAKFLTIGGSGLIYIFPSNMAEVLKVPSTNPRTRHNHAIERRIYERLGTHPNIIKCLRMDDYGIHLERAEHGCIRQYFLDGGTATLRERIQWSLDIANALQHVHEHNIRHADLSGRNILLDSTRNVRLCDFAGSAIDDDKATVWVESGFRHPDDDEVKDSTIRAELHALGSTIYELCTFSQPYGREVEEWIVAQWIREGKYPSVKDVILGDIIVKCWNGDFISAKEVARSIEREFANILEC
ncbi:serine/threonine protein kinase [Byssothecium circinans]|uniref:EKC/KEOPS complex subunit BUD32 n=1 Tax=Byssothecium circinans TaxID=147558 RepID=A0A6A5U9V4_9PLEO|nr:serine/threonine protein kinase [Byssothecium circinans]